MERGCVWLIFLGAIICVDALVKPTDKMQLEDEKVDVKRACYLDDLKTPFINCEVVNADQSSVPHGELCTVEDYRETGATADFICDNGHWSVTDNTIGPTIIQ